MADKYIQQLADDTSPALADEMVLQKAADTTELKRSDIQTVLALYNSLTATMSNKTFSGKTIISGGTVTVDTPVFDITQTWNEGATLFNGIVVDITDTASAAGALLVDLQVGSTSQFKVGKSGAVTATGAYTGTGFVSTVGTLTDPALVYDGTVTWNDGADTFTAIKLDVTDTASAAASLLIDLQVGSTSQFKVDKAGALTATGAITGESLVANNITIDGNTISSTDVDGNINLTPNGSGLVVIGALDANGGTIDGVTINSGSAGVTTPLTQLVVDNIDINGNTIISTDTNGDINLTPNGTGETVVEQLRSTGVSKRSVTAGITAFATGGQGSATQLTSDINEISTCATAGDSVKMPTAEAGLLVVVINNGAASCDVFPASGDNLGAGVDTAVALANGSNVTYVCYNSTNWETI